jgi:lysozyme
MEKHVLAQLRRHEGLRLMPYECSAGEMTIGYGRNLDSNGISQTEADLFLYNDYIKCLNETKSFVFYDRLNDARKGVIINMLFNLGLPRLNSFKKFLAAVSRCDYEHAGYEMLDSKWARQVGARAIELAEQMKTGEWQ